MGIDPQVFGKYFWGTMHLSALGAPDVFDATLANTYKTFFNQIANVLPCHSCKEHLAQTYQNILIDNALTGSHDLFAWTVGIHNAVNVRLGKPIMTVDDARKKWMHPEFREEQIFKNKTETDQILTISIAAVIGAMIALALATFYIYSRNKHHSSR